jgi:hypothetical protein
LKELIPSFATSNSIEINQVAYATKETLCVKNNTIELLESGNENTTSSDDDDDVIDGNIKPASK